MFDWVGLLLRTGYYLGHIIGVSNFEIDWRTGRVYTSTRSTLYAIVNNIIIVTFIVLKLIGKASLTVDCREMHDMYKYIVHIAVILKITSGLATLFNLWRQQPQIMILARNAIRLGLTRPQVIKMSRWRIFFKFFNGFLVVFLPFLMNVVSIGPKTRKEFIGLFLQLWISAILKLVSAQTFLVLLCIRGQYNLLNTELQEVVEESRHLSYNPSRKGAFMTRCCALADQLDDIAKDQSQLHSIADQLNSVYGIQKLVMYSYYYVLTVVVSYTSYNIFQQNLKDLDMSLGDTIFSFTWCFLFHVDSIHNLYMALHVQDGHREMINLLWERTLFGSSLDARLEESFESLQLQLIRNPLKMNVLQLFSINRQSTFAMFASIILHSICLVQYDLENFRSS